MMKKIILIIFAIMILAVAPISFAKGGGGHGGSAGGGASGGGIKANIQAVGHAISTIPVTLESLLPRSTSGGGGGQTLREGDTCTDSEGTGTRYCNFVFNEENIGMTTYTYATDVPKAVENGTIDLHVDVYAPTNDTETLRPMVFFAHGGGGERDNPSIVTWCTDRFAMRGYVCGSIDYRGSSDVAGEFTGPLQNIALSDMQAAVRWARENATTLGIDPNKIILMGSSAGAITAIQAAVMGNNVDAEIFNDSKSNKAHASEPSWSCMAVTLSGALNHQIDDYLDHNDPLAAMYHGEDDEKVLYSEAVDTFNQMVAIGIPTTLLSFPDTAHSLDGHIDEIVADLFPKLFISVVNGTCPQPYSNLVQIPTGGNTDEGTSQGSAGGSGGGGAGGGGTYTASTSTTKIDEDVPSESEMIHTCPLITERMYIGVNNNPVEVKKLETYLNTEYGEHLVIDGIYSNEVSEAVARFELKYSDSIPRLSGVNLAPGNVGWLVQAKINTLACMPVPPSCPVFREYNSVSLNNYSSEVTLTQQLLQSLGFYTGPLDGVFNQSLKTSLTEFQRTFHSFILDPGGFVPGIKSQLTNKFFNKILGCESAPVRVGWKMFDY